jgi:hypothetical protein
MQIQIYFILPYSYSVQAIVRLTKTVVEFYSSLYLEVLPEAYT